MRGKAAWSDSVGGIIPPFWRPAGVWNRLGYPEAAEAANAAGHAEKVVSIPRGQASLISGRGLE